MRRRSAEPASEYHQSHPCRFRKRRRRRRRVAHFRDEGGNPAFVEDDRYDELMAKKAEMPKTKFGDASDPAHVESLNILSEKF